MKTNFGRVPGRHSAADGTKNFKYKGARNEPKETQSWSREIMYGVKFFRNFFPVLIRRSIFFLLFLS